MRYLTEWLQTQPNNYAIRLVTSDETRIDSTIETIEEHYVTIPKLYTEDQAKKEYFQYKSMEMYDRIQIVKIARYARNPLAHIGNMDELVVTEVVRSGK